MPATQAFVLMNLDLVAVPLYAGAAGVVTIYCGRHRASELLLATASQITREARTNHSHAGPDQSPALGHHSARREAPPAGRQ